MRNTKTEMERTRKSLLDASETLFGEKGVARTTILDIVREAGLTRGAFYHHFKSKGEVLSALIESARFPQEAELLSGIESNGLDGISTLQTWCRSVFELFVADKARQRMFGILLQHRAALGELEDTVKARRNEIFRSTDAFEKLLKKAQRAGQLSPKWSPSVAALTLQSTMFGLLDQWVRNPEMFDICKTGIKCVDQLLASFRAERPPENL